MCIVRARTFFYPLCANLWWQLASQILDGKRKYRYVVPFATAVTPADDVQQGLKNPKAPNTCCGMFRETRRGGMMSIHFKAYAPPVRERVKVDHVHPCRRGRACVWLSVPVWLFSFVYDTAVAAVMRLSSLFPLGEGGSLRQPRQTTTFRDRPERMLRKLCIYLGFFVPLNKLPLAVAETSTFSHKPHSLHEGSQRASTFASVFCHMMACR